LKWAEPLSQWLLIWFPGVFLWLLTRCHNRDWKVDSISMQGPMTVGRWTSLL
jgi:hypothetical protein